jgi:hypothetical protein
MINRGFCAEHGAVSDELADSIKKCSGTHRRKKLTLASVRCGAHAPLLLLVAVSIVLVGCVGGKATTSANQTPTISVSMVQAPPSPLSVGSKATVAATVSDDVANAGVDWVPICNSTAPCGSFSPAHTASGAPTTFTAPNGVPAGNIVALTALSTTDKSKAASANVTITSNVTAVFFTQPPPATYPAGGSLDVAAFVAGDPSNEGVDWKAKCGALDCTSQFQATHSGPGVPVTFIVPSPSSLTFPNIVGTTVTLTAIATADHSFSYSATFTVVSTVSISITQAPPPSVLTNANVPVVAVVTNDPTNSGVTWTIVSCDHSPCGSWSTAATPVLTTHVDSGTPATYFAPGTAVNHVLLEAAATISPTTALVRVGISVAAQVSIAITTGVPNNTITQNARASLVATVSTDPANLGVDWTVTCGSAGACGSFSSTHTASGVATSFTAPGTVPTGNTVTITATSTSDKTKTASETVTVKPVTPASLLTGQWVMLLTGKDANGGSYALGGEIAGDGGANPGDGKNGTILSGLFDLADMGNANAVGLAATPKSTYSVGTDGRGTINLTLDTSVLNGSFGVSGNGLIVLSVVFVTPQHALLSETDAFGSGTGTLDLQNGTDLIAFENGTSSLSLNGSYTLRLTGEDVSGSNPPPPYFLVGAVSFSFSQAKATYTETSYIADQSDQGVIHSAQQTGLSIPVGTTPGATGKISLIMNLGTQFNLDLWLIDANHFVVTDIRDQFFGTPPVLISGYMVAQPSSPAISGTYAFTEAAKTASPSLNPQAVGGIFTCGSTGTLDLAPLSGTAVNIPTINTACTPPSSGRGKITITGAGTTGISKFAAYPTLDQGLYLIELDGGSAGTSGPSGAGVAMQQTLMPPIVVSNFSGKYASNFLANTAQGFEAFAGQIISGGNALLTGTLDVNAFIAPPGTGPSFNATLATGSFAVTPANPTNGRFQLALTIAPAVTVPPQPVPPITSLNPVCYILDANTCLLLGLDPAAPGTGILQLQNTGLP